MENKSLEDLMKYIKAQQEAEKAGENVSRSGGYKCYNIHCNSCIEKTLCGEPEDKALGCDSRIVTNKSNGDRIRSMSDEELAGFMVKYEGTEKRRTVCGGHEHIFYGPHGEKCEIRNDAVKLWEDWLLQPAEEE